MARPGVTYQEVAEAFNQLLGQGKHPTIERIRALLGTGSSTTIANHLNRLKEQQNSVTLLSVKENIPEELIAVLKGLWERVIDHSEAKIITLQENSKQTIDALEEELQKYKTNNQRWQQLFNQWTKEKAQLVNDKLVLEEGNQSLNKNILSLQNKETILSQQLAEKEARITELHQLHAQVQANLEHYREAAREQRLIEQQQFEQQKHELQTEIIALREQSLITKEKCSSLQKEQQELLRNFKMLEKSSQDAKIEITHLQKQLTETEKLKNEFLQAKEHWQQQYQLAQQTIETKISQAIEAQAEIKVLSQQLAETKKILRDAEDQCKLLGHDKWQLVQEKAQLEGQLKQMQKIMTAS